MKNDISVYVHIPFCLRKCLYCDFTSLAGNERQQEDYLESLLFEIREQKDVFSGRTVRSVYFGGGTPSVVNALHIQKITQTIKEYAVISPDAELSMEMNPGTVDEEKLEVYLEAGINRFSLGMQSANERELKALGRIHSWSDVQKACFLLRKKGVKNINIDIMTGIPYQTEASLKNTLDALLCLSPEHVSAYALILEEGTPFWEMGEKELKLPDEETEMRLYELARDFLEENGYRRYEISNYAKEGRRCRHNLVYWNIGDYVGFGCAAASRIGGRRYMNTSDLNRYIKAPGKERSEDLILTKEEEMSEFIFMGLRKTDGISLKTFYERFNVSVTEVYEKEIGRYLKEGLMLTEGDRLYFSSKGMDISNRILADFV